MTYALWIEDLGWLTWRDTGKLNYETNELTWQVISRLTEKQHKYLQSLD